MRQYFGKLLSPVMRIAGARSPTQDISSIPRHWLKPFNGSPKPRVQPDVYPFAAYLGERFGCDRVLAIGTTTAKHLREFFPRFKIKHLNVAGMISLPEDLLKRAIIVCNDLEQFGSPACLFENLKTWLDHAPVCVLTSTDRDLNPAGSNGFAATPTRPGRWNMMELEHLLRAEGFNIEFIGLTASDNVTYEKKTIVAVITTNTRDKTPAAGAPADFRVVAFMAAYNEADIIVQSIKKWTDQGIGVHILENWSTDATYELAKQLENRLAVTVERFPKEGPSSYFDWGAMLERIEILSREIKADWFVRRGADEVLMSPWPSVSYRDGLYVVDQAGFNCVDHTIIEFPPVDDGFEAGADHEAYFKHFVFEKRPINFMQRKAWKNYGQQISMVSSGGHDLPFEGRRVYPFKFLLKHYPVRSQEHGEKKVFRERKARWNPEEKAKGWHRQYDSVEEGHLFLRPSDQELFAEDHFNKTYLVERLSGIGIRR